MAKKQSAPVTQSITWDSVRRELNSTRNDQGGIDYDKVRRDKLAALSQYTKRPAVLYATDFLNETKMRHAQNAMSINPQDVRGLAEVVRGLEGDALDLILHSPGGSAEPVESMVAVLRSQFKHVRVLVPVMAKSAVTMIALAANEILMPVSAELGPIDPQFLLSDGRGGQRMTPAQAIIDDVERAQQTFQAKQPDAPVWLTQVQSQPVGLYQQALNAVKLSKTLMKGWLQKYMFAGDTNAAAMADVIVNFLGDHNQFLSHARRVDFGVRGGMQAKVYDIRAKDPGLWQLLEELWYVVEHNFMSSPVFKMWENSNGVALFQILQIQVIMRPGGQVGPLAPQQAQ